VSVRDLASQIAARSAPPANNVTRLTGTVGALHAGNSPVLATVDVYVGGSTTLTTGVLYPKWYTPAVGDNVALDLIDGQMLIVVWVAHT
jgi:hypothetical protein